MGVDIKKLKPNKFSKFRQGYFHPKFPDKYRGNPEKIVFRSSWEKKFMNFLDLSEDIVEWGSETFSIKYFYPAPYGNNAYHQYFPDFYFVRVDENNNRQRFLVEVKPKNQLQKPHEPKRKTEKSIKNYNYLMECYTKNYFKNLAAKEFCKFNNMKYVYLTEDSNLA